MTEIWAYVLTMLGGCLVVFASRAVGIEWGFKAGLAVWLIGVFIFLVGSIAYAAALSVAIWT